MLSVTGVMPRLCQRYVVNVTTKKPGDFVIATGKQYTIEIYG